MGKKNSYKWLSLLGMALFLWITGIYANNEPMVINATVTADRVEFSPSIIPENVPFVIHVINKAGSPVELENADTSVEIYPNVDRTFKVGLTAGSYVFFNDFNAHTKTAALTVRTHDAAMNTVAQNPSTTQSTSTPLNITGILFIVWRESVEALLVVGIVYGWITLAKKEQRRSGLIFLALGVGIGLVCAVLLSFLLMTIHHILSPESANAFQALMTFIAAAMIVYMVKWMRNNARKLKGHMHQSLEKNTSTRWRNISILIVTAVAVAREASEAIIFIYALGFGGQAHGSLSMLSILGLGVLLAIATIYLLQLGNKIISWRLFFKVTELLLLLLGGGLLLNGMDRLILSGFLSPWHNKIWDTSFFISDGGFFAPMLSSFIGYRATPSLTCVIGYGIYWIIIYFLMKTKHSEIHAV